MTNKDRVMRWAQIGSATAVILILILAFAFWRARPDISLVWIFIFSGVLEFLTMWGGSLYQGEIRPKWLDWYSPARAFFNGLTSAKYSVSLIFWIIMLLLHLSEPEG